MEAPTQSVKAPLRILHLEDSLMMARVIQHTLQQSLACEVTPASGRAEFEAALREGEFDLILCDVTLPDYDGLSALRLAKSAKPEVPVIIISGTIDEDGGVASMKLGASDFLLKQRMEGLVPAVHRALQEAEERRQRMAAEKALVESERFNRTILDGVKDYAILMLDPMGRVASWNAGAKAIQGYNADEIIGRHFSCFYIEEAIRAELPRHELEVATKVGRFEDTGWRVRKDGSRFWANVVINAVHDDRGQLLGFSKVTRNITERRQAEIEREQLIVSLEEAVTTANRSRSQLEAVIEAMEDGVFVFDMQRDVVLVNEAAARTYGFVSVAEVRQHLAFFVERFELADLTGTPIPFEQWPVSRILRGESLSNWEFHVRRKDIGREWFIAFSGAPVCDEQGTQILAVIITRDVTERQKVLKELQSTAVELRQASAAVEHERAQLADRVVERTANLTAANEELVRASRFKSEFLATMSHELRTPLNGILGMNELLLRTELTARQREFVEAGTLSGQTLLQLINDILDLSKIEAGKLELNPRECSLEALTYDVITVFSHAARQKGLTLTCEVEPQVCVTAECDDHRLRQILVNLLGNAFKFTASGGVTLRAQCRPANDSRAIVRFSVTDTGVGIPQAKVDRLFSPFSQVDSSTARQFGGTGLGLSISKQLVELMGGTIGVESQLGAGSTFWFEIPLQFIAGDLDVSRVREHLAGAKVLAVDGIDRDRQQIGECLRAWGCPTEQLATVYEALDAVEREEATGSPFAVVLADCQLAVGDESVVLQELAAHPRLPIIGLGTNEDSESADYLHQLGVRHLLTDPVRPSALFNALTSVLSVSVPSLSADKEQAIASREPSAPITGHILVAEDNQINQMFVIELLKHCGCTCDVASNGDEALVALQHKQYDLVLMDCQMPEMDGFTAAREIRRREAADGASRHIPIIALTANALKGDRERCLEAGMDDYLSKPLQVRQLLAMLEKHLSRQ